MTFWVRVLLDLELLQLVQRYSGIVDKLEQENAVLRGRPTTGVAPKNSALLEETSGSSRAQAQEGRCRRC